MIKKLKQFTLQMIAGANIATILFMLFVGYSDRISPLSYPTLSNIGLTFPFFLLANLAFLLFWLLTKPRWSLIPIGGFLLGFQPLRTYCPINMPQTVPDDAIKVISYNVYNYASIDFMEHKRTVIDYLKTQNADIASLQEYYFNPEDFKALADQYPYYDTVQMVRGGEVLTLLSKFPILGKERISNPSSTVHSAAFHLFTGSDTLTVINNHLESTRLTEQERINFKKIVKGDLQKDSAGRESRRLIDKLAEATSARAPQVKKLVGYLRENRSRSIILCGDFNDGPISYAHHLVSQHLSDCYVMSGNGPGISYHEKWFFVRIDHMMCSDDWTPYKCKIDSKNNISDHYPLICWLKKQPKPQKNE